MPTRASKSVHAQTVAITRAYLGPAAGRFIDQQVRNHLHIKPEDITKNDLSHIIEWVRLSISLLTNDDRIVNEYIDQLEQLADSPYRVRSL